MSLFPMKQDYDEPIPSQQVQSGELKANILPDLSTAVHDRLFFQINNKENSNLIQVFSQSKSIWRGNTWSEVHFKVRLHSSFVTLSKQRVTPLVLAASIQRENNGRMYGNECNNKVRIEFVRTPLKDKSYATVDCEPCHQVKITLHNTMFDAQETFVLRVDVDQVDENQKMDAFVFGCSQSVWVAKFSFVIEPDFLKNQHVVKMDEAYVWFGKCGTINAGLDANVSLKNELGETVFSPNFIPFTIELLYDDCMPAPEFALSAHKLRETKFGEAKPMRLFTSLTPNPAIQPFVEKASFTFRIEEVSFHHPGHAGFKIKISALIDTQMIIHPAILSEVLIVLSKPKYESGDVKKEEWMIPNKRKYEPIHLDQPRSSGIMVPRQVSVNQAPNHATVNLHQLAACFLGHGACMCCQRQMQSSMHFFSTERHDANCHAVTNLIPRISWFSFASMASILSTADNLHGFHRTPPEKSSTTTTADPLRCNRMIEPLDQSCDHISYCGSCDYTEI